MSSNLTPTPGERQLLRGIAAARDGTDGWWSAQDLREAWPEDFGSRTPQSLSALAKHCARKGLAETRPRQTHARTWKEYRITPAGREAVADSCIGGGLKWSIQALMPACPACGITRPDLTVPLLNGTAPDEIPAHPLPGYHQDRESS